MITTVGQRLHAKSAALLLSLEGSLSKIMFGWIAVAALASIVRVSVGALGDYPLSVGSLMPYWLLVAAPVVSMMLALRWFADGESLPQPATRLAQVGRWRNVSRAAAMRHPLYGTSGLMVSLLIGMLINVPVRATEYLLALPAIAGPAPAWLEAMHLAMTIDVVLVTSLYSIAFVAALRRVPLFPRLLVAIWMIDILMQIVIAKLTVSAGGIPHAVAMPLQGMLTGNIQKVLISVCLWLPYLLLSRRVNVTFRNRIPA